MARHLHSDWDRWRLSELEAWLDRPADDEVDKQRKIANRMTRKTIGFKIKLKCLQLLKEMRRK